MDKARRLALELKYINPLKILSYLSSSVKIMNLFSFLQQIIELLVPDKLFKPNLIFGVMYEEVSHNTGDLFCYKCNFFAYPCMKTSRVENPSKVLSS